jgi:hypothetical protein
MTVLKYPIALLNGDDTSILHTLQCGFFDENFNTSNTGIARTHHPKISRQENSNVSKFEIIVMTKKNTTDVSIFISQCLIGSENKIKIFFIILVSIH